MTQLDYQRLMLLYDGELSVEEATRFQAQLRQAGHDALADDLIAGLDQVGDVVRVLSEADVENHAHLADGIADDVLRQIEVVTPAKRGPVGSPTAGSWGLAAGVTGALALAAGVLLFAWASAGPQGGVAENTAVQAPVGTDQLQVVGPVAHEVAADVEADPGVAIEMVDFGAHSGTIFMVSAGGEAQTPVVWLVDEGPDSEGRVKQL